MDAARRGYYHVYGGSPGLTWLLDGFTRGAWTAPGSTRRSAAACSWTNPARAFAFAEVD